MLKLIRQINRPLLLLLFATACICSCKENEIYPDVPSIKFKEAYVLFDQQNTDSLIVLVFTYKDGDGDLGLNEGDTLAPYDYNTKGPNQSNTNRFYNNVLVDYYEKKNGEFYKPVKPFTSDTVSKDVRVGNLTPDGKHKAIRGDIQISILPVDFGNDPDTIRLKARLVDRALHVSNEIETPDLFLIKR